MGASTSFPQPLRTELPDFSILCIFFNHSDELCVIGGNEDVIKTVKQVLKHDLHHGVENVRKESDAGTEIKIFGHPFRAGEEDDVKLVDFCGGVLRELLAAGWQLVTSTVLTRHSGNAFKVWHRGRSTWFFKKTAFTGVPKIPEKLPSFTVIGANELLFMNILPAMEKALVDICNKAAPNGVQEVKEIKEPLGIHVKFHDKIWDPAEKMESDYRQILLGVIACFEEHGWAAYGAANAKGETDTLYFVPGALDLPSRVQSICKRPKQPSYFAMELQGKNLLRLLNGVDPIYTIIQKTIERVWTHGIDRMRHQDKNSEFHLKHDPWYRMGSEEIHTKSLMNEIFQDLHNAGWALMAALYTNAAINSTSLLMFHGIEKPEQPVTYFCISLCDSDTIRVIGAPQSVCNAVHEAATKWYMYSIESTRNHAGAMEIQLLGELGPWGDTPEEKLSGHQLMAHVLDAVLDLGYFMAVSADISERVTEHEDYDDTWIKMNAHTWWFVGNPERKLSR